VLRSGFDLSIDSPTSAFVVVGVQEPSESKAWAKCKKSVTPESFSTMRKEALLDSVRRSPIGFLEPRTFLLMRGLHNGFVCGLY